MPTDILKDISQSISKANNNFATWLTQIDKKREGLIIPQMIEIRFKSDINTDYQQSLLLDPKNSNALHQFVASVMKDDSLFQINRLYTFDHSIRMKMLNIDASLYVHKIVNIGGLSYYIILSAKDFETTLNTLSKNGALDAISDYASLTSTKDFLSRYRRFYGYTYETLPNVTTTEKDSDEEGQADQTPKANDSLNETLDDNIDQEAQAEEENSQKDQEQAQKDLTQMQEESLDKSSQDEDNTQEDSSQKQTTPSDQTESSSDQEDSTETQPDNQDNFPDDLTSAQTNEESKEDENDDLEKSLSDIQNDNSLNETLDGDDGFGSLFDGQDSADSITIDMNQDNGQNSADNNQDTDQQAENEEDSADTEKTSEQNTQLKEETKKPAQVLTKPVEKDPQPSENEPNISKELVDKETEAIEIEPRRTERNVILKRRPVSHHFMKARQDDYSLEDATNQILQHFDQVLAKLTDIATTTQEKQSNREKVLASADEKMAKQFETLEVL